MLPDDISPSNVTVETLTGIEFPEYICVQGSPYPDGILHRIRNLVQKWLDGHFRKIYKNYLEVGDRSGEIRRVLLEGAEI